MPAPFSFPVFLFFGMLKASFVTVVCEGIGESCSSVGLRVGKGFVKAGWKVFCRSNISLLVW